MELLKRQPGHGHKSKTKSLLFKQSAVLCEDLDHLLTVFAILSFVCCLLLKKKKKGNMSLYLLKKQWLLLLPLLLHLTSLSQVNYSFKVAILRVVSIIKNVVRHQIQSEKLNLPFCKSFHSVNSLFLSLLFSFLNREFNPLFHQVGQLSLRTKIPKET